MRIFDLLSSWCTVTDAKRVGAEPDHTRRLLLTGVAAVVATGVIAVTVPSTAEAGGRHSRRRSDNWSGHSRRRSDGHSRRRSDDWDRHGTHRSRGSHHGSYRSGSGWGSPPGCYIGPLFVSPCPF